MKSRNYSFLVFVIVTILILTLSVLSNNSYDYPLLLSSYRERLISSCTILLIALIAVKISYRIGMQQCWYGEGLNTASFLSPIFTGIALGGLHILTFEILELYPFEGTANELFPLISETLLMALVFNFSMVVFLIYISDILFDKRDMPAVSFWIIAALMAASEPIIITILYGREGLFDSIIQPVFLIELYFITGLVSIAFLRYMGFLQMILFRIFEILTVGLLAIILY